MNELSQVPFGPQPFSRLVSAWHRHCNTHQPDDYGWNVIGWHRTHEPECHRLIFPDGEPWWAGPIAKPIREEQ